MWPWVHVFCFVHCVCMCMVCVVHVACVGACNVHVGVRMCKYVYYTCYKFACAVKLLYII